MRAESTRVVDEIRVLQSFKPPTRRTNPYITQLLACLDSTPGVRAHGFSWREAMVGRFDVFHAHWPESLIEQRGVVSTFGRRVLYALFLLRLWAQRIPVVRTVHNLDLPTGISWFDRRLLAATERLTRVRVLLNEFTPVADEAAAVLVEHGHYRSWFEQYPRGEPVPGAIVFFGKIRRYKNVEALVEVFRAMPPTTPTPTLSVLGSPSSPALVDSLSSLASGDDRITLQLAHVEDAELVAAVSRASVVALPYKEMHNSGSVLAALSLGRPVLVPDNDFNRALGREVGEEWVMRYADPLTPHDLRLAVERAAEMAAASEARPGPDLGRRDWENAGRLHLEAYRRALRT